MATACPVGCTTHGVCDPVVGQCMCPLTRTGTSCSELALPACAVRGQPLRPTFLLHRHWERHLFRDEWLGPLTCSCIEQMVRLRHLVQYNNPWVARRQHSVVCATGGDVGSLLAAPQNATWSKVTVALLGTDTAMIANQMPPVNGLGFFRVRPDPNGGSGHRVQTLGATAAAGIGALEPLHRCPQLCGSRGYCTTFQPPREPVRCVCYPPAVRNGRGSCADPPLPRSAPLPRPATVNVRTVSGWEKCPAQCSGHGSCDYEGFCHCPVGFFGLDCALTLSEQGEPRVVRGQPASASAAVATRRPVAGRASARRLPCIYVYDLPPLLRLGDSFEVALRLRLRRRRLPITLPFHHHPHHSPLTTHHSPLTIHHSALSTQHSHSHTLGGARLGTHHAPPLAPRALRRRAPRRLLVAHRAEQPGAARR